MEWIDLDIGEFATTLFRLFLALAFAFPIAWEREQSTRIMGIRTYPLVAMGSCAYFLVAQRVFGPTADPMARVFQGLIQGIGFLGTAAIIKQTRREDEEGTHVRGTATAASIWITGVLGAATAYGFYEIAAAVSLLVFVTLRFFAKFKV